MRVALAAEERAARLRERVAARIARALAGAEVEQDGERIVVTGRGVIARYVGADDLRHWQEAER